MNRRQIIRAILPHVLLWGTLALSFGLPDVQAEFISSKRPMFAALALWSLFIAVLWIPVIIKKLKLESYLNFCNICTIFAAIILVWEVFANKVPVLDPMIFTCPARVFLVFPVSYVSLIRHIGSSMYLLIFGFFIGITVGISVGLVTGWFKPLFNVIYPMAKIGAPIPPPVYIPFVLVLFPSVAQAAMFIIFIGAFWPTFANTCFATATVDKRYVEAAQMLGARSSNSILRRVVFRAILPQIFAGIFIGMILAFIMLIVAEMVGASSGLGYYLITQRLVNRYDGVIAGILTIGMVVIIWSLVFDYIEKRALRWKATV